VAVNNNITLGIGNCALESNLGAYYQDFKPALSHFDNNNMGSFDENGIPYLIEGNRNYYSVIYVIQYALIQFEYIFIHDDVKEREKIILNCLDWIVANSEEYKGCMVWRSEANYHYGLEKGWISGMYQGQAISLFLRAYQHFGREDFLLHSHKVFAFFEITYEDGGVRRFDADGYLWFEEYPTTKPSFVLNGFIYTVFGILDYYRVTNNPKSKDLYIECIRTLINNVSKYDRFYWTVYDQLKVELVSFYYQKNVHIPLMGILYKLTNDAIFDMYHRKWQRQLNNPLYKILVKVMYRVQPRIIKLIK